MLGDTWDSTAPNSSPRNGGGGPLAPLAAAAGGTRLREHPPALRVPLEACQCEGAVDIAAPQVPLQLPPTVQLLLADEDLQLTPVPRREKSKPDERAGRQADSGVPILRRPCTRVPSQTQQSRRLNGDLLWSALPRARTLRPSRQMSQNCSLCCCWR